MTQNYFPEEWKEFTLNDCDSNLMGYQISNYGRVRRRAKTQKQYKLMYKFAKMKNFDMFFYKKKGNKAASYYLHRAVAQLFVENKENKRFVIHLDYNFKNNNFINLQWVNRAELDAHRRANPKSHPRNTKLNEGKVRMIKRKLFDPKNKTRVKMIAKQFGVSTMQIWRIKSGENWSHVKDW